MRGLPVLKDKRKNKIRRGHPVAAGNRYIQALGQWPDPR